MEDNTTQPAGLQTLPSELQCFIIHFLDPISLFSLSQTSRVFRRLIDPGHAEQIERLLALECLPRYGGDGPAIILPDDEAVAAPDWNCETWHGSRWACAICLRLLPHTHFDNHFILRRKYRKPAPGSPAAIALTAWEPALVGRRAGQKARRQQLRQSTAASADIEDGDGHSRHPQQLGYARIRRKCNECRFQRKELGRGVERIGWPGFPGGTTKVPIQTSRRVAFNSLLDRYFPGLGDSLEVGPRPFPLRKERIIREDVLEETWTMYMVRCPGCEHWQELRAFRFGGHFKQWKPAHDGTGRLRLYTEIHSDTTIEVVLDNLLCNSCFMQEHGRDALGRELLRLFRTSIQLLLHQAESQLTRGWFCVKHHPIPHQFKSETLWMVNKVYGKERDKYGKGESPECMTYSRAATLRMLHAQFKDLWTRMRGHANFVEEPFLENIHFMTWLECYHESEANWFWLRDFKLEVEENPHILVTWALAREGASLT